MIGMKWLAPLGVLLFSACGSGQEAMPYTELVLKGDLIAKQIQGSLAGTKGELHADRIDPDGKRHPGSWVQLGPALKDRRFEFSLPDKTVDLGYAGSITYRVNDVRLNTIAMVSAPSEFVLSATFLSDGVAIKGAHNTLGESVVPGIKLDNIRLAIHLKPEVLDGKVSYDEPRVEFTANVDNTFIPRFTVMGYTVDVMDGLTHYRHDLCASVQRQIQLALDDPARKAALGAKIQEGIAGQLAGPNSPVIGLRFQGTDLVVRLRR